MEKIVTPIWIATLATSIVCFILKVLGYSLPESVLNKPLVQRINSLIPIALLSSLVAVQTLGNAKSVVIDHTLVGVLVAAISLRLKVGFPVMMLLAAISSALVYNLYN
jgi:branched-subunit amino acid transport protein AzlD